jgi:aerobic carbon-monoxide dehydrogenase medium subunit
VSELTASEVLIPTSADEAAAAFGDGAGVTVIGGGTIVMPEITRGRLRPAKAILLGRAGLGGVSRDGSTVTIGATTPVSELEGFPAPLGPCAANVADGEIRGQATVGGNLCAGPGPDAPRGDLQAPLLALGATVRSVGAGGEATQPLEEFLPAREGRLVLDVTYEEAAAGAGAWISLDRPHTHDYTSLAVAAARSADGSVRLAASGVAGHAVRLPSAEAKADDPAAAGRAALGDVTFGDDALASAWYRERTLPVLVARALTELKETA